MGVIKTSVKPIIKIFFMTVDVTGVEESRCRSLVIY